MGDKIPADKKAPIEAALTQSERSTKSTGSSQKLMLPSQKSIQHGQLHQNIYIKARRKEAHSPLLTDSLTATIRRMQDKNAENVTDAEFEEVK